MPPSTPIQSGSRLFVTTNNTLPFFNIGLRPDLVSSDIRSDISMSDYDPNDPARNTYLKQIGVRQRRSQVNMAMLPRALEVRGPMRLDESFAAIKQTKIGERYYQPVPRWRCRTR